MKILHLTAGTGSFYCGTCIRDNVLVRGLVDLGHEAELLPLYMPIVAEGASCSAQMPILMSGINCYLQQTMPLFRSIPPWMDQIFATRPLLQLASGQAGKTRPEDTGPMTLSMLRGEEGFQAKEIERLATWVEQHGRPDVIVLSNALLVGLVAPLKRRLGVPVVCTLQGEIHFVDAIGAPWASQAWPALAAGLDACDGVVAVSAFVADAMSRRAGLPRHRIDVVHNGISLEGFRPTSDPEGPARLGFLARMYSQKGLPNLATIFADLRGRGLDVELVVAGTLNEGDEADVVVFEAQLEALGVQDHVHFRPNLSPEKKREVLSDLTVFCVPSDKDETFGLYHLEALASGVPVVAPRRGAIPEVLKQAGGAILFPPNDLKAAADAIASLLEDRILRRALAAEGRAGVEALFTQDAMARAEAEVLQRIVAQYRDAARGETSDERDDTTLAV